VRGQRRGGSHIIKSKTKAQSKPFYLFKISLKMRSAASHRLVAKLKLLVKTKMEMEMQRCNRLCEKLYPAGFLWAQSLYAQLWLRLALLSALGCTSGRPTEGIYYANPDSVPHSPPLPLDRMVSVSLAPSIDNYLHRLSRSKVSRMREIRVQGKRQVHLKEKVINSLNQQCIHSRNNHRVF